MAFETIPQPKDYAERVELAERTQRDFDLTCDLVVDAMDDRARAIFGDQPNSVVLIGPDGVVRLKQPWANPDELDMILPNLLPELNEDLQHRAKSEEATLRESVAASIAAKRENTEARFRAGARLAKAREEDRANQLLELLSRLDEARTRKHDPQRMAALLNDAKTVFAKRPAEEAAFLADLVDLAPMTERAPILDRIGILLPEKSLGQRWVRTKRDELEAAQSSRVKK